MPCAKYFTQRLIPKSILIGGLITLVSLSLLFSVSCQAAPSTTTPAEIPASESLPPAEKETTETPAVESSATEKEEPVETTATESLPSAEEEEPAERPATESLPSAEEEEPDSDLAETVTEIDIINFSFQAATITIPVGTTVTWTHRDSAPHTVTTRINLIESGTLSRNGVFSYTFTEKGTFEYYCRFHPYMIGTIIVE